jgi:hypothetical protein
LSQHRDAHVIHEERRRSRATSVMGAGSLACPECDAPVWPGERGLALTALLRCPYCLRGGAVREFLSLEPPRRPARVLIRLRLR